MTLASAWPEAVFHVLAHVDVGRVPASCFDPAYVRWAASHLGDATERTLAEDARALAVALATHDALGRAQALAWVFEGARDAGDAVDRDLDALSDADVQDARALAIARSAGDATEVLRAAAELELPRLAALPRSEHAVKDVDRALAGVIAAAPALAEHRVALARPLGRRGRVLGASIFVGAPGVACPDAEHAAWQAAHEATVHEVLVERPGAPFAALEREAIERLTSRARAASLGESHARWLRRLDLSSVAP